MVSLANWLTVCYLTDVILHDTFTSCSVYVKAFGFCPEEHKIRKELNYNENRPAQLNRVLKKLRLVLQRNRHIKLERCVRLRILWSFHVSHVVQNRPSVLSPIFAWHKWFHIKAKNERLTAAGSRCRQKLKNENFTSSFDRLRQNIAPKACRTCSTILFGCSINQIIDLCRSRCLCCLHFINSLIFERSVKKKCTKGSVDQRSGEVLGLYADDLVSLYIYLV